MLPETRSPSRRSLKYRSLIAPGPTPVTRLKRGAFAGVDNPQRERIGQHGRRVEQLMRRSSKRHPLRGPADGVRLHMPATKKKGDDLSIVALQV